MSNPTPEERAAKIMTGVHSVALRVEWQTIPDGPMPDAFTVDGFVPLLERAIADAIREAVAAEREACAALAETHLTVTGDGLKLTPTPGEIARSIRQRGAT